MHLATGTTVFWGHRCCSLRADCFAATLIPAGQVAKGAFAFLLLAFAFELNWTLVNIWLTLLLMGAWGAGWLHSRNASRLRAKRVCAWELHRTPAAASTTSSAKAERLATYTGHWHRGPAVALSYYCTTGTVCMCATYAAPLQATPYGPAACTSCAAPSPAPWRPLQSTAPPRGYPGGSGEFESFCRYRTAISSTQVATACGVLSLESKSLVR